MPEAARITRVVTIKSDKLMTLINRCCMNASPRTSAVTLRMIIEQTRQKNVTAGSAGMIGASSFLQNQNRRAFDGDAGERSRSPRAGVDVHPVSPDVGMRHRRVAMNDEFAVGPRRVEKFLTNPEQIVEVLLLNRNAWTNACMHEQEVAAAKAAAEALQKDLMCTREGAPKTTMRVNFSVDPRA